MVLRFSQLVVRMEKDDKLFASLQIEDKVIYVTTALITLLVFKTEGFMALIYGSFMSALLRVITSIFFHREIWDFKNIDEDNVVSFGELVKYGYPYIFSMGITMLFQAVDKISLNTYCTYTEVGVYSSAMSIVNIFAIIQTTFNTIWAPTYVEHYSKYPDDRTFFSKANKIITVIMFGAGITLILFKDLFALLLGEKYREAAYILPFLIFNPIMYTISETTVVGLVICKKSKYQVLISIVPCIINLIGNTMLVPRYGCQGAAISTGISYIFFFLMRTIIANRFFKIEVELRKFYTITVLVSVYAMYNTWVKFNYITVVGYLIVLFALVVLYRDTVIWIYQYMKNFLHDFFHKKGNA